MKKIRFIMKSYKDYRVIWDTPGKSSLDSMPIGNGESGMNVWTEEDGSVLLYISRTDSWDENERLCKIGRLKITLNPALITEPFKQTLKLDKGYIEIKGGIDNEAVTFQIWIDAFRQAAHIEIFSKKLFTAEVELQLWRKTKRTLSPQECHAVEGFKEPISYPDTICESKDNSLLWYHHNTVSPFKDTLKLQGLDELTEKMPDPLLNRVFGANVFCNDGQTINQTTMISKNKLRHHITIITHTLANTTPDKWLAGVDLIRKEVEFLGIDRAREETRQWWKSYWDRSYIFSNSEDNRAQDINQAYILQRWISICGSRGHFPVKFNGSIFTVDMEHDPDYRQWGGGYWFQNTRLVYWPMLASGDTDSMLNLFEMFKRAMPLAKHRTQKYFNHNGAFFPETMSFWGTYLNGVMGWCWREGDDYGKPVENNFIRFHYSGNIELLYMMITYMNYTLDDSFLHDTLLPIADEMITWWDEHWERDTNGKLYMYPSYACETYWNCENPSTDIAGLKCCLLSLLNFGEKTIGEQRKEKWGKLISELPEMPLYERDGKKVIAPAYDKLGNMENVENPELYTIFPYPVYGLERDDLNIAIDTYFTRKLKQNFGWCQDETQAAYLGLTEEVVNDLHGRSINKHDESRFPAFWGPNYDWVPDQDHGGNILMAFQTMLIQEVGDKILLFPAWPKDWNVKLKLQAAKQTTVEVSLQNGKIEYLNVSPESRRSDIKIMLDIAE
jgi:hypothetical protein